MRRVLQITLLLIIPSFVFYYGWSSSRQSQFEKERYLAKVKLGKLSRWHRINPEEVEEAEIRLIQRYSSFADFLGLPERIFANQRLTEAIPQLPKIIEAVNFFLLMNYAHNHGIVTSQDEVILQFRSQWPQNTAAYLQAYMRARNIQSEQELVYREKRESTVSKAKYAFYTEARASLFELWQQYLITDEEIQIDYVKIPIDEIMADMVIEDEEELVSFYEEHKEDYKVPEQYRFDYFEVSLSDLGTTVTISESDVATYYEKNKERFLVPKRVKARHILLDVFQDATPQQVDEIKTKAENLYQQIMNGAPFEELANEFSDEYKSDEITTVVKTGGLIGWVSRFSARQYGETFVNNVLALENPGDVTPPFRTEKGFEIVRADEIDPQTYRSLEEVAESLESFLFSQRCKEIIDRRASEFSLDLYKYTSINALAKEFGEEVTQTEYVEADEYFFEDLGNLTPFKSDIEEMIEVKEIRILPRTQEILFMQLHETVPARIPDLENVIDKVTEDYNYQRALEIAEERAEKLEEAASRTESLKERAEGENLEVTTTEYFTRDNLPEEMGTIENFHRVTLETSVGDVLVSKSVDKEQKTDAFFVWVLKDKKPPTLEEFKEEIPRLERELIQIKRETILNEYLADARRQAQLDINPLFLNP